MAADGGRAVAACSHRRSACTTSARLSSWHQSVPSPPDPISGTGNLVLRRLSETSVLSPQKTHSSVDEGPVCALTSPNPGMGPGVQHYILVA